MLNPGEGQEDRHGWVGGGGKLGWVGGGGKLGSCSYSSTFTIVVVTLVFPTKSSAPRLQGLCYSTYKRVRLTGRTDWGWWRA